MLEPMERPLPTPPSLPARIRGLRRIEYDKLVETGALEGVPVELLDGMLVTKVSPAGADHSCLTERLAKVLTRVLPPHMAVRMNMPFAASDDSEPEPDIAVVEDSRRDAHPERAYLLVEVCHSSDYNDRVIKTRIYAQAKVPEYWIVDVDDESIEIYTKPRGKSYAEKRVVTDGAIAPLALPDARVELAALFAR